MGTVKRLFAVALLLLAVSGAFSEGADIIVLMDASGTILPWFEQVNTRILPDITRKFVREGDTFHLVSFNSRVNLEIVQPIKTEADISRVVSRFMLLYPLGQNSDFLSGLKYTWQYSASLNQQRQKIFIVVSDGIFNPPATSAYASYKPEEVKAELSDFARRIRGAGWHVYYIKLPFPESATIRALDGSLLSEAKGTQDADGSAGADGSSATNSAAEGKDYLDVSSEFTDALQISPSEMRGPNDSVDFVDSIFAIPEVTFPDNLGKKGRYFTLPLKVKNPSDAHVFLELTGVMWDDVNILEKTSFLRLSAGSSGTLNAPLVVPDSVPVGDLSMPLRLRFADDLRVHPQSATVRLILTSLSLTWLLRTGGFLAYAVILVILAAIAILIVFLFLARKTSTQAAETVRAAGSFGSRERDEKDAARTTSSLPLKTASGRAIPTDSPYREDRGHSTLDAYARSTAQKDAIAQSPADTGWSSNKKIAWAPSRDRANEADNATKDVLARQNETRNERYSILSVAANKAHARIRRQGASKSEAIAVRAEGRAMIELDVHNQNKAIGKRNVHMMKAGSRLGIGGGTSAFLVFLVRFPANVAEIRYDGLTCDLAILKPEYFPYETDVVIKDCIGRDFTIVSDKEYEVTFSLREYDDPVARLNKFLTSILY